MKNLIKTIIIFIIVILFMGILASNSTPAAENSIKITVPESIVEGISISNRYIDNKDGTITYEISNNLHNELINAEIKLIDNYIASIIEGFSDISEIRYLGNYSQFDIYTSKNNIDTELKLIINSLIEVGKKCNIYRGTPIDKYTIRVYNESTHKLIKEIRVKQENKSN